MNFHELVQSGFVFLDGAMGTMLQQKGMPAGSIPEIWGMEKPDWINAIHRQYIDAGAHIIYANTFGANRYKLASCPYQAERVIAAAVQNARKAAQGTHTLVALDVGPLGQLLEPTGSLTFEQAYEAFAEQVSAGVKAGADLIAIETMTDLYEAKAALLAAKETSTLPVLCTMTFEENQRTFTGCSVSAMALTLEGLGADAIGLNCSLGPAEVYPIVAELMKWTRLPVIVKPNAGLPDPLDNQYHITPAQFADEMARLAELGVRVLGGCCGTTPAYIAALREKLGGLTPKAPDVPAAAAVCTPETTVQINMPRIIGERINPTGKKRFKQALTENDLDYILSQAIEQVHGGAEILDVNVGLPDIDEKAMMVRCVKAIQSVVNVPLQLDSTSPAVLEAALRVYNGKAIVNSVNGEKKSLETILPLVKKYGAAVVGLTLDEDGIPAHAEGRLAIAARILAAAEKIGIRREDVYIDALTLTASAEQAAAGETLKALHRVKTELGLKTVLGVSNISFGLPARELVNSTFLTMALSQGLDLPILNPNLEAMTGAVRAYRVLANLDRDSADFIAVYAGRQKPASPGTEKAEITLAYAIENGLKREGAKITARLLESMDAMTIINTMLIPALDKAGTAFESGQIFLPQLISAAGVAQAAFEVLKEHMAASDQPAAAKDKIILATVKGDIHDIGKNIVKVLLENYGYDVIDLGRDVPPETIVSCALANQVKLVGLSALMTTTLGSMKETIRQLHEQKVPCTILVGGAVLTPEYAAKIGADYYAKDAKQSVDIAKKVLG